MSYDPSHRKPRHSGRRSHAITPEEAWPALGGDAYPDGAGYLGGGQGGMTGQEPQGSYWAAAGHQSQPGHQDAFSGSAGYGQRGAAGGYGGTAGYAVGGNGWGQGGSGNGGYGRGAGTGGYGGYGGSAGTDSWSGWTADGNGYAGNLDTFDSTWNGYAGQVDAFDGTRNGYARNLDTFDGTRNGYGGGPDTFDGARNGYGDGFAGTEDGFDGSAGYPDYGDYAEPVSADPALVAPDAGVSPESWHAEREARRAMGERGPMVSAVAELLAVAVAIGVSTLAAAFVGLQASPIAAAGGALIDRMPLSLKSLAVQHFGAHGRTVLLLGMYVVIALLALEIGVLARRSAALGVAGVAALSLLGAFIVISRSGSRAADIIPMVIGGVAGVAALLWLQRASAPAAPFPPARGGRRRA
jgi:hypothetical protein